MTADGTKCWDRAEAGITAAATGALEDEFYLKAITGQADLESDCHDCVAMWRRIGGEAPLAEYAKSPLVDEFIEGKLVY